MLDLIKDSWVIRKDKEDDFLILDNDQIYWILKVMDNAIEKDGTEKQMRQKVFAPVEDILNQQNLYINGITVAVILNALFLT